jgi:hypothetical protein
MRFSVGVHSLALAEGQVLVIDAPAGLRLQARRGCAWVTRDGDLTDTVLTPLQAEWRAPDAGRLVVQAMRGPLQLEVRRLPQRQSSWRVWLHGLQRVLGPRAPGSRLPEAL